MIDKRQLLCPIGGICRLILLNFKSSGTKIKICNNTVVLVSPDENIPQAQGLFRWLSGDSKDDICVLYPMIIRFIELYLCPQNESVDFAIKTDTDSFDYDNNREDDNDANETESVNKTNMVVYNSKNSKLDDQLKILAKYLCDGLTILQKTYNYNNAVLTLQYYILLIQAAINGTYTKQMLPAHLQCEKKSFFDIKKMKDMWDDKKLERISDLFVKSFEAHNSKDTSLLVAYDKAIISILDDNDITFREYISTSMM